MTSTAERSRCPANLLRAHALQFAVTALLLAASSPAARSPAARSRPSLRHLFDSILSQPAALCALFRTMVRLGFVGSSRPGSKTTDGDTATRRRSMESRARKCGMPAGRTLRRDVARGVLHRAQRPLACTRVQIHWRNAARFACTLARPRAGSLRVGA